MANKQQLRDKLFNIKPQFNSKVVNVEGMDIEIRQPSIKLRKEIFDNCRDKNGQIDLTIFPVWAIIKTAFVPDTDEFIFVDQDIDRLTSYQTGTFVDELSRAAVEVVNSDTAKKNENT